MSCQKHLLKVKLHYATPGYEARCGKPQGYDYTTSLSLLLFFVMALYASGLNAATQISSDSMSLLWFCIWKQNIGFSKKEIKTLTQTKLKYKMSVFLVLKLIVYNKNKILIPHTYHERKHNQNNIFFTSKLLLKAMRSRITIQYQNFG